MRKTVNAALKRCARIEEEKSKALEKQTRIPEAFLKKVTAIWEAEDDVQAAFLLDQVTSVCVKKGLI